MSGVIFFICSTSAISALSAAPRISASLASPKGWRKGCKNNQKKTGLWLNPGRRLRTWPVLLLQVLQLWTVRLRREARRYSKLQVDRLDHLGSLLRQTQIIIPTLTQRRVPKDVKEMLNCSSVQGNLWQRSRIRTLRISGKSPSAQGNLWQWWGLNAKDVQENSKFQKIQNREVEAGHIISIFHLLHVLHMEKVFSIVRKVLW